MTTNCQNVAASLPQPKRIQSQCPATAPLGFWSVLPQFSSGGMYHLFGNGSGATLSAFGLAQSGANGVFNWQVASSNGAIVPINSQGRVFALQDLAVGISNATCIGVYDRSGGAFVPVFEKQLPINNRFLVGQAILNNGSFILSLNRSNSVSLLGMSPSGTLLWAKELTAAGFPTVLPSPADPGRTMTISEIGTNNVVLSLSANVNGGAAVTNVTVLIRLDSSGTLQWSKTLQIPLVSSTASTASSAGSQVFVMPDETVLVSTYDYSLQGTTVVQFTHLTKITGDGTLAWSRKFLGGILASAPRPVSSQGSLLLDFLSSGAAGGHNVCGILDTGGQISSLIQVDPLGRGNVRPQAVSISAGEIYFAGASGSLPIIGASSLNLTNFTAKEYVQGPLSSQTLTLLEDGRLAFVGTETNLSAFHLVLLNSSLGESTPCGLFAPSTLNVSPSSITVDTNLFTLADLTVASSNATVSLPSAQLRFYLTAFQDQALCTANCDYGLFPDGISLNAGGGSTNVTVAVTSLSTCNWGVTNPCPDWITVSPASGTGGGAVTIGVSTNAGNSRNCTLTIAGLPFIVTQGGNVGLLGDAVDAPDLVWTTGGDAQWSFETAVTHDGVDAAQSGTITDGQQSWLQTTVQGPGTLTFWWKVSSQAGSDRLRFYVNGIAQNNINGEIDWRQMTYNLASGTNVLQWRYLKDASGSAGQDRAWLDQVVWAPTTTCTFSLSSGIVGLGTGGGSTNVSVIVATGSNCDWTVLNPCANWLTVSPTNGTGGGPVTISATPNSTGTTRTCTVTVAGSALNIVQAAVSSSNVLVQYNPTGAQSSGTPVPPVVEGPNITASFLQQIGLEATWNNTDVWPVGRITTSPTLDPSQYLTFTLQSANAQPIAFKSLSYDKQSYLNAGPTHASLRSSLDSFAADIAAVTVNPAGFQSLSFDLSGMPATSSSVTFRIYFYGAPSFTDYAGLVSTAAGGNGLVVTAATAASAPIILVGDAQFGFAGGKFGFNLTGPAGQGVVIESSTDLKSWTPVQTNAFGAGLLYFSDPQSTSSGAQFYRARLQ